MQYSQGFCLGRDGKRESRTGCLAAPMRQGVPWKQTRAGGQSRVRLSPRHSGELDGLPARDPIHLCRRERTQRHFAPAQNQLQPHVQTWKLSNTSADGPALVAGTQHLGEVGAPGGRLAPSHLPQFPHLSPRPPPSTPASSEGGGRGDIKHLERLARSLHANISTHILND